MTTADGDDDVCIAFYAGVSIRPVGGRIPLDLLVSLFVEELEDQGYETRKNSRKERVAIS